MNSERPNTKIQTHVFKFLTSLTTSVEKTESSWVQVSL